MLPARSQDNLPGDLFTIFSVEPDAALPSIANSNQESVPRDGCTLNKHPAILVADESESEAGGITASTVPEYCTSWNDKGMWVWQLGSQISHDPQEFAYSVADYVERGGVLCGDEPRKDVSRLLLNLGADTPLALRRLLFDERSPSASILAFRELWKPFCGTAAPDLSLLTAWLGVPDTDAFVAIRALASLALGIPSKDNIRASAPRVPGCSGYETNLFLRPRIDVPDNLLCDDQLDSSPTLCASLRDPSTLSVFSLITSPAADLLKSGPLGRGWGRRRHDTIMNWPAQAGRLHAPSVILRGFACLSSSPGGPKFEFVLEEDETVALDKVLARLSGLRHGHRVRMDEPLLTAGYLAWLCLRYGRAFPAFLRAPWSWMQRVDMARPRWAGGNTTSFAAFLSSLGVKDYASAVVPPCTISVDVTSKDDVQCFQDNMFCWCRAAAAYSLLT